MSAFAKVCAVAMVAACCDWAADLPIGEPADLVPFGRLKGWTGLGDEEHALSANAGPPWTSVAEFEADVRYNLGVEWDEPREVTEVRVAFEQPLPPDAVQPEYWVWSWPAPGRGGWTPSDSPWQGEWRPIRATRRMEGGTLVFRFQPLSPEENLNANHQRGFAPLSRVTLKVRVRLLAGRSAPVVRLFQVFGQCRWNARDVRIESGEAVAVDVYNGRIVDQASEPPAKLARLRLMYLEHPPESRDRTILMLRTRSHAFGVSMDDVIRHGGVYVRDAGVFVADGPPGHALASWLESGRLRPGNDIVSRVAAEPEQSLERALADIPRLAMTGRDRGDQGRYVPVGFFGNREKYAVSYNGNVFISKTSSKVFREERDRMLWSGNVITYRIGTGVVPDFRERENSARQRVLDDYQPLVLTDWSNEGVDYRVETLVTLLDAPLDAAKNRGDERSVLLIRLQASNPSAAPRRAVLWLHVAPDEGLRIRDGLLEATSEAAGPYPAPRFRAALDSSRGQFTVARLPAEAGQPGSAARWEAELEPGATATFHFRLTFKTPTDEREIRRLAAVDYDFARAKVVAYWKDITAQGMRLDVPDPMLNRFYRAVLQHILVSVMRDVPSGLYMDPCGTYGYNMIANETNMQVRQLELRGLHDLAARFVEPFVALQGSKPFPGRYRDTSAMFHGVRPDANHDYTMTGYNLNHGWTLWTLAEHYLFTRDTEWFRARLPKMLKAAEWIVSERQATMQTGEGRARVPEYGLLPAGRLEDNKEWGYWFAVNAYAYRGLRAFARALAEVDPARARRFAGEADRYREDIRAAVLRAISIAPVAPLGDGTWIPTVPPRARLHGRDRGWIRNILYGAHALVDCGVFATGEQVTTWILQDLEDNLFMSPESFNTREQDWFSRGGITLQPNLVNTAITYLARDQVPHALRAFYNTFAVSIYPDVYAFSEWVPSYGRSGGPFFKTSDEAGFLTWLRFLLVSEDGDNLRLAAGAPRRWFRAGEHIEVGDAATFFGRVSFRIDSRADAGSLEARVVVPAGFRAREISLRLRHPDGKPMRQVQLNGRPWTRFDTRRELVMLPATPGTVTVRVAY